MPSVTAIIRTLALGLGLSIAVVSFADDNEPVPEIQNGGKPQTAAEPKPAPAKKNGSATSKPAGTTSRDSTFKPTEEISEDLSVPFPVDI